MIIHGVYQAIDPVSQLTGNSLREAFAIFDDKTIMGYTVVRATNFKTTGTTSHGLASNAAHVCAKAQEEISGYFTSAIEPFGDKWQLTVYERGDIQPLDESVHATANDAMLAGRQLLKRLADECVVS